MDERITEILEDFKFFNGEYKRDLVDQALELKDEISPHLIQILESVRDNPEPYLINDIYFDHIYAFMLLGYFEDPKAHDVIIDIFSLPDDIPSDLFGDSVTENLPEILIKTCGGSLARIKELILNKDAYDYCRTSAIHALVLAVVEGYEQRESVLSFLCGLFTGKEADIASDFWGLLAMYVLDLYPEECLETIKDAYDNALISPGMVGYASFEKALEDGKQKSLYDLEQHYKHRSKDNFHESMSWWACFNQDNVGRPNAKLQIASFNQAKPIKSPKKKKKKKRKMAKKSRRKNR